MRIYLVQGFTGEYDDACEWPVCAYDNIDDAEKHAIHAKFEADRIFELWKSDGQYGSIYPSDAKGKYSNAYDEGMKIDYTGTNYMVIDIELHKGFKKV